MINIVIADHLAIFRAGLARVLAAEDDIRIVGQTDSPERLLSAASRYRPAVISVSSAFLPALSRLRVIAEDQGIALLMVAEKEDDPNQYLSLGFQGVITRSADSADFLYGIRQLAVGGSFIHTSYGVASDIVADHTGSVISKRLSATELRIIAAAMRGYKNREIAQRLGTNEPRVKNALRGIFDKLGTCDRLEMTLYVLHHKKLAHAVAAQAHAFGLGQSVYSHAAGLGAAGGPQVN